MAIRTLILLILFGTLFCFAAKSQNIFVLEKPGRMKNFKYYQNDQIRLRMHSTQMKISGTILFITDTSLILTNAIEIAIRDIERIYTPRWGYTLLQGVFLTSGFLYVSLNALNGIINNDDPIIPNETLIISGSLLAAGVLLAPLTSRTHKIDKKKWRLKILDFTP